MGLIDIFKDKFTDWSINTKFEFYRGYLDKHEIPLLDYYTILSIEEVIQSSKPFSLENKNLAFSYTDKLMINKSDKSKYETLQTKSITAIQKFDNTQKIEKRLNQVNRILDDFSRSTFHDRYLFTKRDAEFVLDRFYMGSDYSRMFEIINLLDNSLESVKQRRALVAVVLYMYTHFNLELNLEQFKCDYYTDTVHSSLKRYLYAQIR